MSDIGCQSCQCQTSAKYVIIDYMAKRKVPLVENECYHIYSRGNSKQKIFLEEKDYEHFVKCLYLCNTRKNFRFREDVVNEKINAFDFDRGELLVFIGAYTLMPNHFHIYIKISPMSDIGKMSRSKKKEYKNNISEFMRKLLTAYTKYFNGKYGRTGSLYEGSFKSVHIKNENQAKYLFSYIHLNIIKLIQKDWKENGIKNKKETLIFLSKYKWSSYNDYQGIIRLENKILNREAFPEYFSDVKSFDKEIFEWLSLGDKDIT